MPSLEFARELVGDLRGRDRCIRCGKPIRGWQPSSTYQGLTGHRRCIWGILSRDDD